MKWARSKLYGFTRYEAHGVRILEGTRQVYVAVAFGRGRRASTQRYWRVEDAQDRHRTIGCTEGYLRLKDAKAVAEDYLRAQGRA